LLQPPVVQTHVQLNTSIINTTHARLKIHVQLIHVQQKIHVQLIHALQTLVPPKTHAQLRTHVLLSAAK
jgi:hypothetical protein